MFENEISTEAAILFSYASPKQTGTHSVYHRTETSEILLEIRPQTAPNPLVLEIGLSLFLAIAAANRLAVFLVNHPELFRNRHKEASPGP